MTDEHAEFRLDSRWLTLIVFLVGQTGAAIWWASSMTTSMEFIKAQITVQAQRDLAVRDQRIDENQRTIVELTRQVNEHLRSKQ